MGAGERCFIRRLFQRLFQLRVEFLESKTFGNDPVITAGQDQPGQ
jgi:hypothetical protein